MHGKVDERKSEQPYVRLSREERGGGRRGLAGAALAAGLLGLGWVLWSQGRARDPAVGPGPLLVCYYTLDGNLSSAQLGAAADLCSHINVAFARVQDCRLVLEEGQRGEVGRVAALRGGRALRVLLSVGGSGQGGGFAEMVRDHASRKTFIRSVRDTLRNLSLDGLDLDWEFPGVGAPLGDRQRQHFSQLVRELRAEFTREHRPYLLTVAVAAPDPIADAAYDVDQLDLYADWLNLMTYDFHYYSKLTPFTGHNAPLYARADERLYLATLNGNHTAHAYLRRGLRPARAVLGVPAYGHSFTLVSRAGPAVGSPARGYGSLGSLGFVSQHELCGWLRAHGDAARRRDRAARVPYLWRGTEWVSYEDGPSVQEKAALVRRLRLGGAMVYSLNADDPAGQCGGAAFPLTRALHAALSLSHSHPPARAART